MVKPLGDKVMVKPDEAGEQSIGGIYLPDSAKEKPSEGVVQAVGSGRILQDGTRASMSVKVGDRVIFSRYGGTKVKMEGEEYVILDEDSIFAVKE